MSPALTVLAYVSIFAASLWVPYILGAFFKRGFGILGYPDNPEPLPAWAKRAERADLNGMWTIIESNDDCGSIPCCSIALVSFIVSCVNASELFDFAKVSLNEVAPFVHFFVVGNVHFPVPFGPVPFDDSLRLRLCRFSRRWSASKALSARNASKDNPSMSCGTPTISLRWPGRRQKRTRLPSASVRARTFVLKPPFERPMA